MDAEPDYTGKHQVVLPVDYMNSVEAVCELHADQIAAAALSLDIPGLRLSATQRLLRCTVAGLIAWLIPVIWLTCI